MSELGFIEIICAKELFGRDSLLDEEAKWLFKTKFLEKQREMRTIRCISNIWGQQNPTNEYPYYFFYPGSDNRKKNICETLG